MHVPDSKVHGANMGPTWILSAPDGPHVGPMSLAIKGGSVMSMMKASVAATSSLTYCDLVTSYADVDLGQHWFS